MYANDNGGSYAPTATALTTLQTGNYLQAIPNPPASVCLAIAKSIGTESSSATALSSTRAFADNSAQYDCVKNATANYDFQYKG